MVSHHLERHLLFLFVFVILFSDGHVLHLRLETVAVRRWIRNGLVDYDGQMVARNECGLMLVSSFLLSLYYRPIKFLIWFQYFIILLPYLMYSNIYTTLVVHRESQNQVTRVNVKLKKRD